MTNYSELTEFLGSLPSSSQVKELKSRMADMEGQPRPTIGLSLLENKIQELEERLHSEERSQQETRKKETAMI